MKRTLLLIIIAFALTFSTNARDIKVLAIGNSFSVDVVEQNLHELAKAEGTTLVVGNLYIGGCGLQKHLSNLRNEKKAYSYRKVDENGEKTTTPKVSIQQALADEKWDYVMVQQVSGFGGVYVSFGRCLPEIMKTLRELTPYKPKFIITNRSGKFFVCAKSASDWRSPHSPGFTDSRHLRWNSSTPSSTKAKEVV